MLIKFERRDPSLPPINRVHVARVPARELSSPEANVAIVDGILAVIFALLSLPSIILIHWPPSMEMILFVALPLAIALSWGAAAFAMTRGHWIRWWIQAPMAIVSFAVIVYGVALTGQ